MARKERNDVDYFPHPVNHGKKMFYLRDKYGNDGYTVWFMLLEELGKSDHHFLDLKDEVQLMYLSSELKVSEDILKDIINILVKFDEFDKELWQKENILYNQKFVENIFDAYKKRKNECVTKDVLVILLTDKGRLKPLKRTPKEGKGNLKDDGNTQTKEKNTKVNYTKEFLSEINISDLPKKNISYYQIAISFFRLFEQNLKDSGSTTTTLYKAKGTWINDIRLMIEVDKCSIEQLQTVWKFLQTNEFWKKNILSTSKLRKQIEKLILQANGTQKEKNKGATIEDLADVSNTVFSENTEN